MGFRLASPFRRIVAIRKEEGDEVIITGGVDVSVLAEAIAQLGGSFATKTAIVVRVTGAVTHLLWGSPGDWSGAGSIATSFTVINESTIYGKGGDGGTGGISTTLGDGSAGGHALELQGSTVDVNNGAGNLWGGGGGGGASGRVTGTSNLSSPTAVLLIEARRSSGGGGAGGIASNGGSSGGFLRIEVTLGDNTGAPGHSGFRDNTVGTLTVSPFCDPHSVSITDVSVNGQNGGTSGPGTGGTHSAGVGSDASFGDSGAGGNGGDFGQAGSNGNAATGSFVTSTSIVAPRTGGAAGKAINLGGGTANFLSGNNGAQVKGAVS